MFDRSFLSHARLEFVVVSDTHYMLHPGTRSLEFESRRLQTARAERALCLIASLGTPFVVHLGDLVQEFPERERFEQAMAEAREQLERCGVTCRHVAGNHDVGDKPDPTMPTDWVTPGSLAAYHALYGRSWYSWDQQDIHFIALNSQIMNTTLPQADEQRRWVESDLVAHAGQRTFMFLHLPPFLEDEHEPALGHYHNLGKVARAWLLNLVRKHKVEVVFASHTHFAFFDRIGESRYFVATSPTFTGPGFGESFSSAPPPERGRDDSEKLGFHLVRVQDNGTRVHLIRTGGDTRPVDRTTRVRHVITRLSRDLGRSPLGITLCHPLAPVAEIPIAFPSTRRQRVRNDYPLLACTELGVRHVRIPASDLNDRLQRGRLAALRDEGVQITATWLWSDALDLTRAVARYRDQLDDIELQMPGTLWPDKPILQQARRCTDQLGLPVALCPLIPKERVPGKQHSRPRFGYRPNELRELDHRLSQEREEISRVLCRVDPNASPWDSIRQAPEPASLTHIGSVDWLVELSTTDEHGQIVRTAEATFAAGLLPESRLFLEPLVDLDRSMDVSHGLLDRLSNPRPAFHVVRCMNTILFGRPEGRRPLPLPSPSLAGARILGLAGPAADLWLLLPLRPGKKLLLDLGHFDGFKASTRGTQCFDLKKGTSQPLEPRNREQSPRETLNFDGATLLVFNTFNQALPQADATFHS